MHDRKKFFRYGAVISVFVVAAVAVFFILSRGQKPEYIFLMGDVRSFEDYPMFKSFEAEITRLGGVPKVLEIEESENSSITQIQKLKDEVSDNTVCIIVNAASNENLAGILKKYQEKGIKILSCISEVSALYRMLHVGTVNPRDAGPEMMKETAKLLNQHGQFALVSGVPHSVSMTTLMMEIRYNYEQRKNPELLLTDILFGYEEIEGAVQTIREFLQSAPDTQALICLSERMTEAACMAVKELNLESRVQIVGMGNPGYLDDYLNDDSLRIELYYCDMSEFGTLVAELALKMVQGEVTGNPGEVFKLDGRTYLIEEDIILTEDDIPGSEVYFYPEYIRYKSGSLEY